ncbi:NAD(P)/FAD-dependent oxidoreductase [Oceanibaculum pacificum]|uniref:Ferredoxin--NADP reductase n=1 Tax=Oceanibaculum pacificum TaxID=580166 RepID=A0A154WFL8_9PROT|nr:NAD(P)/FAD-dependent oxidoreductase [Oceanibaculum pacificum]KZD12302.1 ferredoxin--NADP(+) reductase [Oceanibaculum pacificum]
MSNPNKTDVAIIGAGPVGLFAIFQLGMLGFRCQVVDALDGIGGQCIALYPEKPIFDIPGYPKIEAAALIHRLEEQASPFAPIFHLGQQATGLTRLEDGRWRLETSAGTVIEAGAVVIAAGSGAFGPNRPPIEGIEAYEGKSLHYMVKRREDFRGKKVVIAGGGDSAVDWALSLSEIAQVMVVHRRGKFRAAYENVCRLEQLHAEGVLELVVPYQLQGLEGHDGQLDAVTVSTLEGTVRRLEADAMLAFFGLSMNLGPIAEWGLALERHMLTVDPATCQTSVPGIFAIGDINTYPGKLKLILTGFAEAAHAAHAIHPILRPDTALHFEYSTTKGVPAGG